MAHVPQSLLPNLTHELKTPLHSILTLAQLLLSEADGPLAGEQKKQVEMIIRNGEHLLELILDLLQYSSLETRSREIVVEEFSLTELFDSICDAIQPLAERNHVILERNYSELPDKFITDRTLLRQIVHNLVSNAVKFTPSGGVVYLFGNKVSPEIISIEVVDSGIGIAPEVQKKIFDEFYQAESGEGRRFGGVGIGLSLVKTATVALDGKIELRSEEGQGSLFRVELPSLIAKLKRPKVLVLEADPVLKLTFSELLKGHRIDCCLAANGAELMECVTNWYPDLILIDLDTDYSMLRQLRKHLASKELPIIVISPQDSPEERAAGFRYGASDYIVKPFDNVELLARLKSLLKL